MAKNTDAHHSPKTDAKHVANTVLHEVKHLAKEAKASLQDVANDATALADNVVDDAQKTAHSFTVEAENDARDVVDASKRGWFSLRKRFDLTVHAVTRRSLDTFKKVVPKSVEARVEAGVDDVLDRFGLVRKVKLANTDVHADK